MFSHVMLGANDIEKSKKFYDALFATLGAKESFIDPHGRVFYLHKDSVFALTKPLDGNPASGANGGTIGFSVESTEQGDKWHAAGLANGGTACEDPPGIRDDGRTGMYLAYLRDPAGNKICALKRM